MTPNMQPASELRATGSLEQIGQRDHDVTSEYRVFGPPGGDETIMAIAGHVSRQMLSRYAHIRTEAKRGALEDVDRKRMAARAQSLENRQAQAAAKAQATGQIQ